ncbi:MAG: tyrosine--tRNA ligase [Rhodospirillaceae bacterium]
MKSLSSTTADLIHILQARGFVHQCTNTQQLSSLSKSGIVTAYNGFDATADSLHIGHLMPIMMLRWIQESGHRPIALMGGGTTKVGDPSGKDETRQLLDTDTINNNISKIQKTFERFLTFGDSNNDAILVNNAEWLDSLLYIPFLRDVGRHFTINRMLTMDSVKLRLDREQPLSFLEFNYMILQSFDFVELYKRYGCILQTGGSDQWGNIVNGADLGRRIVGAELYGLTCPLITTSSGAKMGKTADGAIWLSPERFSAYDYFQYWRNTEDADIGRFLRLFTEIPLDEIARLEVLQAEEINEAKKILAFNATELLHGKDAANNAMKTAQTTFEAGGLGEDLPKLDISSNDIKDGISVIDLFQQSGLCKSRGEARRLIKGRGARLNDEFISDENQLISEDDFGNGTAKISAGKKRHIVIVLR